MSGIDLPSWSRVDLRCPRCGADHPRPSDLLRHLLVFHAALSPVEGATTTRRALGALRLVAPLADRGPK